MRLERNARYFVALTPIKNLEQRLLNGSRFWTLMMTKLPGEVRRRPSPRMQRSASRACGFTPSIARHDEVGEMNANAGVDGTTVAPTVRLKGGRFHPSEPLVIKVVDLG